MIGGAVVSVLSLLLTVTSAAAAVEDEPGNDPLIDLGGALTLILTDPVVILDTRHDGAALAPNEARAVELAPTIPTGATGIATSITAVGIDHPGTVSAGPLDISSTVGGHLVIEVHGWFTGDAVALTSDPPEDPPEDPPTIPAQELPRRVLVISDSSGAGMRRTPGASAPLIGAEFTLDLESCRRLVATSCMGREGYRPTTALQALQARAGDDYDTLIMFTGYNDLDTDFPAAFDWLMQVATDQGFSTVIWATYREDVGYMLPTRAATSYIAMNETLWERAASGEHPELHVMDWWGYTFQAPHWFTADGVHFSQVGSFGLADLIARTLAALDGRACPMPWAPGDGELYG